MNAVPTTPRQKLVYLVGDAHISRQLVQTNSPETSQRFSDDRSVTERSYLAGIYHTETILHACQIASLVATNAIEPPYLIDGPLMRVDVEYNSLAPHLPTNTYSCKSYDVDLNSKPKSRVYVNEDLGLTLPNQALQPALELSPELWRFEDAAAPSILSEHADLSRHEAELRVICLQINFYGFLSSKQDLDAMKKLIVSHPEAIVIIRIHDRSGGRKVRESRKTTKLYEKVKKNLEELLSDDSVNVRVILEISADDLRQEGMFISQNVSWARTTDTLVHGIKKLSMKNVSPDLKTLSYLKHMRSIVVTFGPDGAVVYTRSSAEQYPDGGEKLKLIFQPDALEHELEAKLPGRMQGTDSIVTASIAHHFAMAAPHAIPQGEEFFRSLELSTLVAIKAMRTACHHAFDEVAFEAPVNATDAVGFRNALISSVAIEKSPAGDVVNSLAASQLWKSRFGAGAPVVCNATITARLKAASDPQVLWHFASPPPDRVNQKYAVPQKLWLYPFDLVAGVITQLKPCYKLESSAPGSDDSITKFKVRIHEEFEAAGWLEIHYLHERMFWRMHRKERWSYMESTALRFSGTREARRLQRKRVTRAADDALIAGTVIPGLVTEFMRELAVRILLEGPEWAFNKEGWQDREVFMGGSLVPGSRGLGQNALFQVNPCARVGGAKPEKNDYYVLDRKEAENFRVLRDIVRQNFPKAGPRKNGPVNIAVYGPPGAGKSYSVRQLLGLFKTGGRKFEVLPFNLSQFSSVDQLADAFDQVQDLYLEGKMPAVFWDEYDTAVGDEKLFWLSRFIGPMWDGEYLQRGRRRKLPACLFVFAGSVFHSFAECATLDHLENIESNPKLLSAEDHEELNRRSIDATGPVRGITVEDWKKAKGKDFKSRLLAKLDVMSPNEEEQGQFVEKFASQQVEPGAHYLRRAAIVRSCLYRDYRHLGLFSKQKLHMDESVARAFIEVDRYYHGARSIELILRSMNLDGVTFITDACLPPDVEMNNHVDGRDFATKAGGGSVPS